MIMHRRSQGQVKEPCFPKFPEHKVILCSERRYPKQNNVIRLKSNISPPEIFEPPQILGWLYYCSHFWYIFLTSICVMA